MNTNTADEDNLRGITIQSFTGSALFERTFDEGMSLVEETAKYLDGRGRSESRELPRKAALLYAGESMRVTTRLMQAASWLLVQRAVHEGDMPAEDALSERYRLGSKEICLPPFATCWSAATSSIAALRGLTTCCLRPA
jgi:regulator of CtrA degradation